MYSTVVVSTPGLGGGTEFCFKFGTGVHTAIASSEAVPLFIRSRILTHHGILNIGISSLARRGLEFFYIFVMVLFCVNAFFEKNLEI